MTPALFTQVSIRPNTSPLGRASSSTASSTATSVGTTSTRPPAASHSWATSRRLPSLLAASTMRAPCSAKSLAAALPMPLEAPVTTTTEPSISRGTRLTPSSGYPCLFCALPSDRFHKHRAYFHRRTRRGTSHAGATLRLRHPGCAIRCQQAPHEVSPIHARERRHPVGDRGGR